MPYQRPIFSMPSLQDQYNYSSYLQATSVPSESLCRPNYVSTPALLPSCNIQLPKPRQLRLPPKVQRQPSETAIVSAAQTLLSLTPSEVPSDKSDNSNRELQQQGQSNHYLVEKTPKKKVSLQDIGIPDLVDDICPTTIIRPTAHKFDSNSQENLETFFLGSTSLALPEDEEFLSPMHCFMRKYCVEAFANECKIGNDAAKPAYGRRIQVGQVGIRCLFCKSHPNTKGNERAVCFPSSLPNIYHSIETWQRRHASVCPHIPGAIRHELAKLKHQSRSGAGGRRQYWVTSAQRMGIVATEHGLRFSHPPGVLLDPPPTSTFQPEKKETQDFDTTNSDSSSSSTESLVKSEDRFMVTDYLFLLMEQMERCYFTEQDRHGTRSKNNQEHALGYPGMQCRHCRGKAGCGRYFPATLRALTSANSDRNLWNHLKKCRKCPDRIREQIDQLQLQSESEKNRRGSRKQFFLNIWHRMHETESVKSSSII